MRRQSGIGPGLVITAAFIGPGTVTTCTLAGAGFGYSLLWTLVFATAATFILQEMSGRLGLLSGMDLGGALYQELPGKAMRAAGMVMVVCAIGVGNAAYQTGNILGASLGLSALSGVGIRTWAAVIGGAAFALLWFGSYKLVETICACFVALMSFCFLVTAAVVRPDLPDLLGGMFIPRLPAADLFIPLGLIGTTIVPYNLFLYASIVRQRWQKRADIRTARLDLAAATLIGGTISMAVVTTAAAAFFGTGARITSAADMAAQLEPLLGAWARAAISIGLFGAGMSSALTAPLAAAYAVCGVFGWQSGLKDVRFRLVWSAVLLTGMLFALTGLQPVPAIVFAQVANGILLPVVAAFLLYVMNSRRLLGSAVNSWKGNLYGGLIILVALALGASGMVKIWAAR